ncbi:MAG: hypothetical protein EBX50_10485 [Chitinophagia bacterium]|jgi:hypothetical protein|nr:hypothetical protein [Chitinophagia bacterium]
MQINTKMKQVILAILLFHFGLLKVSGQKQFNLGKNDFNFGDSLIKLANFRNEDFCLQTNFSIQFTLDSAKTIHNISISGEQHFPPHFVVNIKKAIELTNKNWKEDWAKEVIIRDSMNILQFITINDIEGCPQEKIDLTNLKPSLLRLNRPGNEFKFRSTYFFQRNLRILNSTFDIIRSNDLSNTKNTVLLPPIYIRGGSTN